MSATRGIGIDACPKCGAVDVGRAYDTPTAMLLLTCHACGYSWPVDPLDKAQPPAAPAASPARAEPAP